MLDYPKWRLCYYYFRVWSKKKKIVREFVPILEENNFFVIVQIVKNTGK